MVLAEIASTTPHSTPVRASSGQDHRPSGTSAPTGSPARRRLDLRDHQSRERRRPPGTWTVLQPGAAFLVEPFAPPRDGIDIDIDIQPRSDVLVLGAARRPQHDLGAHHLGTRRGIGPGAFLQHRPVLR